MNYNEFQRITRKGNFVATKDAEIEVHGTLRNDGAPVGHKQVGHGGTTERATSDALRPLVAVGFGTLQEVVRYVRMVNTKNFCEFSGITIKKSVRIRLIRCPISVFFALILVD